MKQKAVKPASAAVPQLILKSSELHTIQSDVTLDEELQPNWKKNQPKSARNGDNSASSHAVQPKRPNSAAGVVMGRSGRKIRPLFADTPANTNGPQNQLSNGGVLSTSKEDLRHMYFEAKKKLNNQDIQINQLKSENQRLERELLRHEKRIEKILSSNDKSDAIPMDVRKDVEKHILVRQLKQQISTLRDNLSMREYEIELYKKSTKSSYIYEIKREKDEYYLEVQRLRGIIMSMKEHMTNKLSNMAQAISGKGMVVINEELKNEIGRLATGYQNMLSEFIEGSTKAQESTSSSSRNKVSSKDKPDTSSNRNNDDDDLGSLRFFDLKNIQEVDIIGLIDNSSVISSNSPVKNDITSPAKSQSSPNHENHSPNTLISALTNHTNTSSPPVLSTHKKESKSSDSPVNKDIDAFKVGDKVEGNYRSGNIYYPATIKALVEEGIYSLLYDDGDEELRVSKEKIRRIVPGSATSKTVVHNYNFVSSNTKSSGTARSEYEFSPDRPKQRSVVPANSHALSSVPTVASASDRSDDNLSLYKDNDISSIVSQEVDPKKLPSLFSKYMDDLSDDDGPDMLSGGPVVVLDAYEDDFDPIDPNEMSQ
jgi:hypothetical protein